jgi:hypothetical protein
LTAAWRWAARATLEPVSGGLHRDHGGHVVRGQILGAEQRVLLLASPAVEQQAGITERLSAYLAECYVIDRAHSAALAEDVLNRTVLPRLLRTLLNVEEVIKDTPDDSALTKDVDVRAIRRLVSTVLPG